MLDINIFYLNMNLRILKQYYESFIFFFKENEKLLVVIIYKLLKKVRYF